MLDQLFINMSMICSLNFEGAQKSSSPEEHIPLEVKPLDRANSSQPQSAALGSESIIPTTAPIITPITTVTTTVTAVESESIAKIELYANDLGDVDDSEPSQTSDSYTVPGSSGMKETHIFTPTLKPSASNDTITSLPSSSIVPASLVSNGNTKSQRVDIPLSDIDQFSSDTIVIKENVVKKEYRDVEYEPNKLIASADDFTDFQFAQPTIIPNNVHIESNATISSSNVVNLSNPSMLSNSTNVSNSKYQSNAINNFLSDLEKNESTPEITMPNVDVFVSKLPKSASYLNSFENSTFNSLPSIDQLANKIPSNTIGLSNGNRSDFEFYSLNDNFHTPKNIPTDDGILNNDTNNFVCTTDAMEIFSISSNDQKHSVSATNTSLQNAPINNSTVLMSSNPLPSTITMNSINSNKYVSNSGILTPQTTAPLSIMNNNASTIQWPEPGINSNELEQFEKRFFSAPSDPIKTNEKINEQTIDTNADDEWSDFVSVVQPQTPITNILNKNLMKQQQQSSSNNDEDDWSEFVSSTPPNLQRFTTNHIAPVLESNSNYESMFKSWNTTFQSATTATAVTVNQQSNLGNFIVQPNVLRQQQQPICTIESKAFQTMAQQSIAPSIISLPDLGFVAPKSLVNMPNISKAKK